jgi:hypothetical protein
MEAQHPADFRLDLVTPLPLEDCLSVLRRHTARITDQRLSVYTDAHRVRIVSSTQQAGWSGGGHLAVPLRGQRHTDRHRDARRGDRRAE